MGGVSSMEREETEVKEKKPELLKGPWRMIEWDHSTRTDLMKSLKEYKPCIDSVPQARILLIGPIGAGKSSFFNSIHSVFRGNMTSSAEAGEIGTSLTLKYRTYQVKASRGGQPLAFLLCDTMGLGNTANGGVNPKDIVGILKGYIPDEYQFNPSQPKATDECQSCSPVPLADRIHCVVYVIDSSKPGLLTESMKTKVDEIQTECRLRDVPQIVLLTKVDRACAHVEKDLKNVYRSCYMKDRIKEVSQSLGIPVLQVLPVKNYSSETNLNDTCDILLLTAMKQILNFADNYLDSWEEDTVN